MDKLLAECFKAERWEHAVQHAFDKGIHTNEVLPFVEPSKRAWLYKTIASNQYRFSPPHEAQIPKDDGTMRTVYVNEPLDRILLSIINDIFMEKCADMIHPRSKAYQKNVGTGKVVKEASAWLQKATADVVGVKADLSKYFDSVPIEFIDRAWDEAEKRMGKSIIIDMLREFYHMDWLYDLNKQLVQKYTSLRQGAAISAWLANVVLYDMDKRISELDVFYVRYSDDILILGDKWQEGYAIMQEELAKRSMKLNPKKVELLQKDVYFKFLGYELRNGDITLSRRRVKDFQKEIENRTIKKHYSYQSALNNVVDYLYKGNGEYSWATSVLGVVNVSEDIQILNAFVMDCLRATMTGKTKLGGLGFDVNRGIVRGTGRNVKANRENTPTELDGYYTLICMQNNLLTSRDLYLMLVSEM